VSATNSGGTSPFSDPVASQLVGTVPQAPSPTSINTTDPYTAIIQWNIPNQGGSSITGYTYTLNNTTTIYATTLTYNFSLTTATATFTITGSLWTRKTNNKITVTPSNKFGTGNSGSLSPVTIYTNDVPGQITNFSATVTSNNSINFRCTLNNSNGPPIPITPTVGVEIDYYGETATGGQTETDTLEVSFTPYTSTFSYTSIAFSNQRSWTFTFTAYAINTQGRSAASNIITITTNP